MKINTQLTDEALLKEIGGRLARARIELNLTQADLAERSGVGKRTIERLESGEAATQLSGFLRVCRAMGMLERLKALLPEPAQSPMTQLRQQARKRKRASPRKGAPVPGKWTWSEPE